MCLHCSLAASSCMRSSCRKQSRPSGESQYSQARLRFRSRSTYITYVCLTKSFKIKNKASRRNSLSPVSRSVYSCTKFTVRLSQRHPRKPDVEATHRKLQRLWHDTCSYLKFPSFLRHVVRLCRTIQSQFAIRVLPFFSFKAG